MATQMYFRKISEEMFVTFLNIQVFYLHRETNRIVRVYLTYLKFKPATCVEAF